MNDTDAWADRVRRGYDTVSHTYRADDDTPADYATWLEHLDVLLLSSAVVDLGCGCGVLRRQHVLRGRVLVLDHPSPNRTATCDVVSRRTMAPT